MTEQAVVNDFIAQKKLAIVGVSRSGKKFGNSILKEMTSKGYEMYPVHPEAAEIDGHRCASTLRDVAGEVGGVVMVVKPEQTEQLVREARDAGITRVWMQQGAHSEAAVAFCREAGMSVVANECLLMFSEPVKGVHGFHRWLWKVFGKLPR